MAEGGRGGAEGNQRRHEQPWVTAEGRNSRHGNNADRNPGPEFHPQRQQQQGRAQGSFGHQHNQGQDNRQYQPTYVPSNRQQNQERQPQHNQRNPPSHYRGSGAPRTDLNVDRRDEVRRTNRGNIHQNQGGNRWGRDHASQASERDAASGTMERDAASSMTERDAASGVTERDADSMKTESFEGEKDEAKQDVAGVADMKPVSMYDLEPGGLITFGGITEPHGPAREPRNNNTAREGRGGRGMKPPPAVITEVEGDLFTAPNTYSLAHCVAADFRMGSGIAVTFLEKFRSVGELLDQRKTVGEVAILTRDDRHVYYLVTKHLSHGKPTYATLRQAAERMRDHCVENNVAKLAMPRVGCGLDRLMWPDVKRMLGEVFAGTAVEITVYNYPQSDQLDLDVTRKRSQLYITHKKMNLVNIEAKTGLLFFCSEEFCETALMRSLDEKHRFMPLFRQEPRKCGNVVRIQRGDEVLYGLVVRKKADDQVSFAHLEVCLRKLRKYNEKDYFEYFGLEAGRDPQDGLVMEKVVTCLRTVLGFMTYKLEMWICWPQEIEADHAWDEERR